MLVLGLDTIQLLAEEQKEMEKKKSNKQEQNIYVFLKKNYLFLFLFQCKRKQYNHYHYPPTKNVYKEIKTMAHLFFLGKDRTMCSC